MTIWAIADVHGCLEKLLMLWPKLHLDKDNDIVVFVGDLIDRGEDSKGVLDFINDKLVEGYDIRAIRGNHEQMCLDYYENPWDDEKWRHWVHNGGKECKASYFQTKGTVESHHLDYMKNLPLTIEIDGYVFVHAGLEDRPLDEQRIDVCLWERHIIYCYDEIYNGKWYKGWKKVICGHTPSSRVTTSKDGKLVCIDTGAPFQSKDLGWLTAYNVETGEIIKVKD